MQKWLAIVVIVGLMAFGLYEASTPKNSEESQSTEVGIVGLEQGNIAPDFELAKVSDHSNVKLSDFRGKKVLLNFWASWCPPCRAEMPEMEQFHHEYGDEIVILAVNVTNSEKNFSDVETFVNDYGLSFPILLDKTGQVSDRYQVVSLPTSYFIDSNGRVQHKFIGAMDEKRMKNFTMQMK